MVRNPAERNAYEKQIACMFCFLQLVSAAAGCSRDTFVICSHDSREHPHPDDTADDDSFRELWDGWYYGFDYGNRILRYLVFNEEAQPVPMHFDDTGW